MHAQFSSITSAGKGYFSSIKRYAVAHKVISTIVAIVVIGGGYWFYQKSTSTTGETRYVIGTVQTGTVISVISGSGQVSPSNQVTINPKASGQITRVLVKNGQQVVAGQALAYIDATTQINAVSSAKADLQSAQLSLQKLQEPATTLQVTQSQDSIAKAQESAATAQTDLAKTYQGSYNDVVASFLDLPGIMSGLQDIVVGTEASHGAQWNIDYYKNATENFDNNAFSYRNNTYNSYTSALAAYNATLADYQKTSQSSATSSVNTISNETYTMMQSVSTALNTANSFLQFYENTLKTQNQSSNSTADSGLTNLNSYITKLNAHLAALLSDTNQLQSDQQAISDSARTITEDQLSLQQLQAGPDTLDIQSSQLGVQQKQNALQQAQDDLANYTITAPFAGTLANLTIHTGDTVGSGTAVATLVTSSDFADLSLNEIDAAKIAVGQKATLTFDAIPDLSLTGSVAYVSPIGTVTQGVVAYDVKIGFDTQDARVKAGMSVNADIQTAVHQNVLEVPQSAIKTQAGQSYVQVFNPPLTPGGTLGVVSSIPPQNVPVTTGISDDTNTEIISGLTQGEQIVTRTTSGSTATPAATATTRGGGFGGGGGGAVLRGL
jgi:HlyD family secretion protein